MRRRSCRGTSKGKLIASNRMPQAMCQVKPVADVAESNQVVAVDTSSDAPAVIDHYHLVFERVGCHAGHVCVDCLICFTTQSGLTIPPYLQRVRAILAFERGTVEQRCRFSTSPKDRFEGWGQLSSLDNLDRKEHTSAALMTLTNSAPQLSTNSLGIVEVPIGLAIDDQVLDGQVDRVGTLRKRQVLRTTGQVRRQLKT